MFHDKKTYFKDHIWTKHNLENCDERLLNILVKKELAVTIMNFG